MTPREDDLPGTDTVQMVERDTIGGWRHFLLRDSAYYPHRATPMRARKSTEDRRTLYVEVWAGSGWTPLASWPGNQLEAAFGEEDDTGDLVVDVPAAVLRTYLTVLW